MCPNQSCVDMLFMLLRVSLMPKSPAGMLSVLTLEVRNPVAEEMVV